MLVRVQNSAGTNAERALIDWLRTWKDPGSPHGVATINCSLFHQDTLHQFDAVIWTPTSCVVIEAEALMARQEGVLQILLNGAWTVSGEPAIWENKDRRTPWNAPAITPSRSRTGWRPAGSASARCTVWR